MDKKGCAVNAQYFTQVVEEEKDLLYRLAYNIMQNTTDSELLRKLYVRPGKAGKN